MYRQEHRNIITISDHPAFEKNEVVSAEKEVPEPRDKGADFIETLFRFLGDKRHIVISFIRMKLDCRRGVVFSRELEMCQSPGEERRCVKKYIGHLKVNDAKALLMSLPEMLEGKIEALTYHGEDLPENRLMKFAKTFEFSHEDAVFCMLFFLMTRENLWGSDGLNLGRAM